MGLLLLMQTSAPQVFDRHQREAVGWMDPTSCRTRRGGVCWKVYLFTVTASRTMRLLPGRVPSQSQVAVWLWSSLATARRVVRVRAQRSARLRSGRLSHGTASASKPGGMGVCEQTPRWRAMQSASALLIRVRRWDGATTVAIERFP